MALSSIFNTQRLTCRLSTSRVCSGHATQADGPSHDDEPLAPSLQVLTCPDLTFAIASHLDELTDLRPLLRATHALRSAALRPDLPLWRECSAHLYAALDPEHTGRSLRNLMELILGR